MPETGKYNVVDLIASTSKTSYSEPVYNKYPGSLFFKNAAVLFMNFDRRGGGDYVNDFEKNGEVSGALKTGHSRYSRYSMSLRHISDPAQF